MQAIDAMLRAHPQKSTFDAKHLSACLEACRSCAEVCSLCADACLAEEKVALLRACIRQNQDCAMICDATAGLLTRLFRPDTKILRAQVELCIKACGACATECIRHSDHHHHCKLCAMECHRCEEACRALLAV